MTNQIPFNKEVTLSDNKSTISDLKNIIAQLCEERDWNQYHTGKELAIGIVTEASELLELFRFKDDNEVDQMIFNDKRSDICYELLDTFYMILRFAQMYNIDLASEFEKNIAKIKKKYPVEKARGSNKKYTEF